MHRFNLQRYARLLTPAEGFLHLATLPLCLVLFFQQTLILLKALGLSLSAADMEEMESQAAPGTGVRMSSLLFLVLVALRLIAVTRQSFFEGIRYARVGNRISDISGGVQHYVESNGYSIVREYVGHGVGSKMHEEPEVPNYVQKGRGRPRLFRHMTIAVEPMVNVGSYEVHVMPDRWTTKTVDGARAAGWQAALYTQGTDLGACIANYL